MSVVFLGNDPGPVTRQKLNDMVAVWEAALEEAVGPRGWSPVFSIANDGSRRVFQIVDWVGGEGDKPTLTGYVGASGIVPAIGAGVDIRGPQGAKGDKGDTGSVGPKGDKGDTGNTGPKGDKGDTGNTGPKGDQGDAGWTPTLAVVSDGARRVHQVVDWTGGEGTKPATGQYVGASGLVSDIAQAVDIRGAAGDGIGNVNPTGDIEADDLAVFADGTGNLIKSGGRFNPLALPDIRPTLNLNLMQKTHDPRIVVTRATGRTYWDANGVLREAGPNEWPQEFDPVTGECLGRSVWEARTNTTINSQNLDLITKISVDVSLLDTAYGMRRFKMSETAVSSAHYANASTAYSESAVQTGQACFWKLPGSLPRYAQLIFTGTIGGNYIATLDLDTGEVVTNADKASSKPLPGGGWLLTISKLAAATGSGSFQLRTADTFSLSTSPFVGDVSSGLIVAAPQSEQGSFPSPYIPTEGTAVTRAADNVSMPIGDWYNPNEGTLVCDWNGSTPPTSNAAAFYLMGGGPHYDGVSVARSSTGNSIAARIKSLGNTVEALTNTYFHDQSFQRSAIAYGPDGGDVYSSGELGRNWSSTTSPDNITSLLFGSGWSGGQSLNGYLRRLVYYPRRLSNAQLQELSRL